MARTKKKGRGRRFVVFLLFVLMIGTSAWAWSVWVRIHEAVPDDQEHVRDDSVQSEPGKDITNIMILGVDQRADETARADTIIIMSINNDTDEVALISIPRDSRVEIPDRGMDKINHSMAYGGVHLTRAAVEKLLGVPMDHYVFTNFTGFQGIVNTLGGVTIDVRKKMTVATKGDGLPDVTLQPGVQRLNGIEALAFVRFRGDSQGDFGRMTRQQQFLKAVADEVFQPKSLLVIPQLMEQAAEFVRTDMSLPQALSFASRAASLDFNESEVITLQGTGKMINGVSYVVLDENHLQQTINKYLRWKKE